MFRRISYAGSYIAEDAVYDKESIFSIGLTASLAIAGSISTEGQPYLSVLYIFSRVFFFMYSHSLHEHPTPPSDTSGGTG